MCVIGISGNAPSTSYPLRKLISGEAGASQQFDRAIAEYHRPDNGWIGTIRTNRWHYIYNPEEITTACRPNADYFKVSSEELYDHTNDPLEEHNVAIERPALVQDLKDELLEAFARQREHAPPQRADPDVIRRLKAMGYLVE